MKIIECPRDAMQGLKEFIPTSEKIRYLNQLLKVGFDTIDAGSFVSAKAIPQLSDTEEVLESVDWNASSSSLLVIVANTRGAIQASLMKQVGYIGFPLSISETFQQRNTNRSIPEAIDTVKEIQEVCVKSGKTLVTYISMGFGNPYNDPYSESMVGSFIEVLKSLEVKIVSLADTVGLASPPQIHSLFSALAKSFSALELGIHLHSRPQTAQSKIEAAWGAGCRRFDGAIRGYGGCPMADDVLVGNLPTEILIQYLDLKNEESNIDRSALQLAMQMADSIFPEH